MDVRLFFFSSARKNDRTNNAERIFVDISVTSTVRFISKTKVLLLLRSQERISLIGEYYRGIIHNIIIIHGRDFAIKFKDLATIMADK